jgi:hypothetical protein
MTIQASLPEAGMGNAVPEQSDYAQIELVWPGKDRVTVPVQQPDGRWRLDPSPTVRNLSPLVELARHGTEGPASGLAVSGDRLRALLTLRRWYPRAVRFAYIDAPRIEIDDQIAAFQGDTTYVYSTWLSTMRTHLESLTPLLHRGGVVAVHVGDLEEPYARHLASEYYGRDNYIGTVVWQRSYGPRNMRGMKEFTATHDCIILFAIDKGALLPVGLRQDAAAAGYSNPDSDPRGAWKAAHKGARTRRARSDFNTFVPPYRWRIVEGRLPDGLWRLNPLTGVIWGDPTESGDFPFTVEVTDSAGAQATSAFVLHSREAGDAPELPEVPWLFDEISTDGELRVATTELPDAVVGREFSALILASGGTPYTAAPKRPGSGRYWEFADETLRLAYARDMVDLGEDGNVIARIKTHAQALGGEVVRNQQTWWPAKARDGSPFAGFTQDATKHLKKLQEMGLVKEAVTSSKPEHLLARLLEIFTSPGDVVLELFGTTADLAAVAAKTGRSFVYLSGNADRDRALFEDCAVPRLLAVIAGTDNNLELVDGEIRVSADAYLPYEGGGQLTTARIGNWLFEQGSREDYPRLNRDYANSDGLASALLTSQGFMPATDTAAGMAPDGSRAVVIPADEYLTPEISARLVSDAGGTRLTVFYFMASDDFDPAIAPPNASFRRVPSEVVLF